MGGSHSVTHTYEEPYVGKIDAIEVREIFETIDDLEMKNREHIKLVKKLGVPEKNAVSPPGSCMKIRSDPSLLTQIVQSKYGTRINVSLHNSTEETVEHNMDGVNSYTDILHYQLMCVKCT